MAFSLNENDGMMDVLNDTIFWPGFEVENENVISGKFNKEIKVCFGDNIIKTDNFFSNTTNSLHASFRTT